MIQEEKEFWERKILGWEHSRYSPWRTLDPLSWSIRARLAAASEFLRRQLPEGAVVLELACGSGHLAARIGDLCSSYVGVDIAANAVALARRRLPQGKFRFEVADVLEFEPTPAHVTVFLGLTDWLGESRLRELFVRIRSPHMLFSFTDAPKWNPYRAYRSVVDGPESQGKPRARTYTQGEIARMLADSGFAWEMVRPPSTLNPGGLLWASKDAP